MTTFEHHESHPSTWKKAVAALAASVALAGVGAKVVNDWDTIRSLPTEIANTIIGDIEPKPLFEDKSLMTFDVQDQAPDNM